MFNYNVNNHMCKDVELSKEDIEAFKKNQAKNYHAHKKLTTLEVGAKRKQR